MEREGESRVKEQQIEQGGGKVEKKSYAENKLRHEYKYVCSEIQLRMLQSRLNGIMKKDSHVDEMGGYKVRSLYFDDLHDSCYYENENGVGPREKYRIRIYNGQTETIHLERKRKIGGMVQKHMCEISREQCDALIKGKVDNISFEQSPELLQKLIVHIKNRYMRPKIIVEYDRIPYVYKNGNVRVTLDKNIISSGNVEYFLKEKIYGRLIFPVGKQLMEVKFDAYLPDYIYQILQLENLQLTAFSKYYLCRKYSTK